MHRHKDSLLDWYPFSTTTNTQVEQSRLCGEEMKEIIATRSSPKREGDLPC